jgi:hypothetical protein
MERKKKEIPTAPKLTKGFSIHKWLEAVNLNLMQLIGVRGAPLAYCVCALAERALIAPALKVGEPHLVEHGESIEGDMIARMSHQHALFKVDNATVFGILDAMLCGTAIYASIAQYRCLHDGRSAYIDVCAQHAGKDVWDKLHKDAEAMLQNRKWNGMANVTLSQHMAKHRQAFITLDECAEQISMEIPNRRSQVMYLMTSTTLVDLAAVQQDKAHKQVNFKSTFAYLVPVCNVTIKNDAKHSKLPRADISTVTAAGLGGGNLKPGVGKTGVALRYHKHADYNKLPKDQKEELLAWNKVNA